MEIQFLNWLQTWHSPILDVFMIFMTHLGDGGLIGIVVTIGLLLFKKTRRLGMMMLVAILVNALLCNVILKPLVQRPRPFTMNPSISLLINAPTDYSFPSGHTSIAFAMVSVLAWRGEKRWTWLTFVIASLIAFSRMYLYVHYPTDILSGILVGLISGWIGTRVIERLVKNSPRES